MKLRELCIAFLFDFDAFINGAKEWFNNVIVLELNTNARQGLSV